MTSSVEFFDDESAECKRCKFFLSEYRYAKRMTSCPDCGRQIPSLSDVISRVSLSPFVLELLPESVARHHQVIPFANNRNELVVLADISNVTVRVTIETIRFILNRSIVCVHANTVVINQAVLRHYGPLDDETYDDPDLFG